MKYGKLELGQVEAIVQDTIGVTLNWARAYEALGMKAEYEAVKLTVPETAGLWTVPFVKGVTCNNVVAVLKSLGVKFYLYANDLDREVTKNDRDSAKGSYVVSFRATIEADEENKNLSANDCAERAIQGITLLERLLLELTYFLATKQHLDVENVTLCAGSRDRFGIVPGVSWYSGDRKVCVFWYGLGNSGGTLRARSVVSLPAKQARGLLG